MPFPCPLPSPAATCERHLLFCRRGVTPGGLSSRPSARTGGLTAVEANTVFGCAQRRRRASLRRCRPPARRSRLGRHEFSFGGRWGGEYSRKPCLIAYWRPHEHRDIAMTPHPRSGRGLAVCHECLGLLLATAVEAGRARGWLRSRASPARGLRFAPSGSGPAAGYRPFDRVDGASVNTVVSSGRTAARWRLRSKWHRVPWQLLNVAHPAASEEQGHE